MRLTDQQLQEWTNNLEQICHADLAWLAGLLEGEGSFHIQRTKRYSKVPNLGVTRYLHYVSTPKVQLLMTDRDIVERACTLLSSNCGGPYTSQSIGYKPRYTTAISGTKALKLCDLLYPFMGQRRQSQIDKMRQITKHKVTLVQPLKSRFSIYEPG